MAQLCARAISDLAIAQTTHDQISAAKHIKNALVGHPTNKEAFVRHGLVDVLGQILSTYSGKDRTTPDDESPLSEEEEVVFQALVLLRSIVKGGPAFISPILASPVVACIPSLLSPAQNHPKVVLACLYLLHDLATTSSLYASPAVQPFYQSAAVVEDLYSENGLGIFAEILARSGSSAAIQEEVALVCGFIKSTCRTDEQRTAIVAVGILDLLAAKVALFHLRWVEAARAVRMADQPLPAPPDYPLHDIYLAVEAIITGSQYRASRFLVSPAMGKVFPRHRPQPLHDLALAQDKGSVQAAFTSPLEYTLPRVHPVYWKDTRTFSKIFPSLGSVKAPKTPIPYDLLPTLPEYTSHTASSGSAPLDESSFIPWLLESFRLEAGISKLASCSLLACLTKERQTSPSRDRMISSLVLPVLRTMLDDASRPLPQKSSALRVQERRTIQQRVPRLLATFIKDSAFLRKVAVDIGAVKWASQLLKQSFDPISVGQHVWPAVASKTEDTAMVDETSATRRIGLPGLAPEVVHAMRCREGGLKMIAAIAEENDDKDKYRKQILADSQTSAFIVDSLIPFDAEIYAGLDTRKGEKIQPKVIGNNAAVLVAACESLRMFARSVTLLRTNLLDAGMAKPLVSLLKHDTPEVRRRALDVCVNLANEFCPMREELVSPEVINIFCQYTHSTDINIRRISLMVLKNLCNKAPRNIKELCIKEIGLDWLMQIMRGSQYAVKSGPSLTMGGNAAGERVDILNAEMDTRMDSQPHQSAESSRHDEEYTLSDLAISQLSSMTSDLSTIAPQYRSYLKRLQEHVQNIEASEAYAKELEMQAGGFDFIRNLTFGDDNAQMIDLLLEQFGTKSFFDLLNSKLQSPADPALLGPSARAPAPHPTCTATEASAMRQLTVAVILVIVHIAAGTSRHRNLLVDPRHILHSMLPLATHSDPEIRRAVVWTIINLTYIDDRDEEYGAKMRVHDLIAMGWDARLRELMENDDAQDIRERASTAVEQLSAIQGGRGYDGGGGGTQYQHRRGGSASSMSFANAVLGMGASRFGGRRGSGE